MKKIMALALLCTLLISILCCGCTASNQNEPNAADVFEMCVGSTVHIETSSGGGTGFFVEDSLIATNNHVIANAEWMTVKTADGQQYNVTAILARSENPDLALIEIDGAGTPVKVSNRNLQEGDALYCIGAPMGIYPCISDGIVMKRTHHDADVDYILSNIHSIGGNSGGPVFNAYGEVVGIVVGGMSDGPNSIDMIIDAKYLDTLEMREPQRVSSKEEWMAEFNKPEEEKYEKSDIAGAQVGQIVSFGHYEQNNIETDGAESIFWIVTDRSDDTLTLMSLYCLDVVPYSLEEMDTTWETSYVREFLNNEFFNSAFSSEEQEKILYTTVKNDDNIAHGTPGGNDTIDKVYMMSLEEAMVYYGIEEPMETFYDHIYAQASAYAAGKGVWLEIADSNRCWWWLRSPGGNSQNAAEIGSAGYLSFNGSPVNNSQRAIRPVMQIQAN